MQKVIALTNKETQIFQTLMDVVQANQLNTTLRVAGGWVRDKVRNLIDLDNGQRIRRYRHCS